MPSQGADGGWPPCVTEPGDERAVADPAVVLGREGLRAGVAAIALLAPAAVLGAAITGTIVATGLYVQTVVALAILTQP